MSYSEQLSWREPTLKEEAELELALPHYKLVLVSERGPWCDASDRLIWTPKARFLIYQTPHGLFRPLFYIVKYAELYFEREPRFKSLDEAVRWVEDENLPGQVELIQTSNRWKREWKKRSKRKGHYCIRYISTQTEMNGLGLSYLITEELDIWQPGYLREGLHSPNQCFELPVHEDLVHWGALNKSLRDSVRRGDTVFFWLDGDEPGLYGSGFILSSDHDIVLVNNRYNPPLLEDELLEHEHLKDIPSLAKRGGYVYNWSGRPEFWLDGGCLLEDSVGSRILEHSDTRLEPLSNSSLRWESPTEKQQSQFSFGDNTPASIADVGESWLIVFKYGEHYRVGAYKGILPEEGNVWAQLEAGPEWISVAKPATVSFIIEDTFRTLSDAKSFIGSPVAFPVFVPKSSIFEIQSADGGAPQEDLSFQSARPSTASNSRTENTSSDGEWWMWAIVVAGMWVVGVAAIVVTGGILNWVLGGCQPDYCDWQSVPQYIRGEGLSHYERPECESCPLDGLTGAPLFWLWGPLLFMPIAISAWSLLHGKNPLSKED